MYCPQCRAEFREGFTECSDCHVPLRAGPPPPEPPSRFDPSLDPVIVLVTNDQIHLAMAKGLLEEAGIPFLALGEIAMLVTGADPLLHNWVEIQVPRDCEGAARDVLAPVLQPAESPESRR